MNNQFDVIIIGGSYSGLAAAMTLGRSLKNVLVIDSGEPCNQQTPYSHNFITHDGDTPAAIQSLAKQQVEKYSTVHFLHGLATNAAKNIDGFEISTAAGETFTAGKLIFATGIRDILQPIDGMADCWGISVLHCPYCHGYEVSHQKTGLLANGEKGFDMARLISNWTNDLTLFTNGASTLTTEQSVQLKKHRINIVETIIDKLDQHNGHLVNIVFQNGTKHPLAVLYAPAPFQQHCTIPQTLGCTLTDEGYIATDASQKTNVGGIFACGDNTSRVRTLANAVAMGTTAGIMVNREIVVEKF